MRRQGTSHGRPEGRSQQAGSESARVRLGIVPAKIDQWTYHTPCTLDTELDAECTGRESGE